MRRPQIAVFVLAWFLAGLPLNALEKTVSLRFENECLRDVLKSVSDRYGIGFVFQDELVEGRNVTCRVDGLPLNLALDSILDPLGISRRTIIDGLVVLYNDAGKPWVIQGHVVDAASGEGLPNANILQEGTARGTTSDLNGYFSLKSDKPDSRTLRVSYIGYHPEVIRIRSQSDSIFLKIELQEDPVEGESVTVIGERFPELELAAKPGQIVFSPQKTDYIPVVGNRDYQRALQFMPGVGSVYDRPSVLSVYGGAENENLVLLDGIPIYKPQNYLGFLSAFHPRAVEKVNFLKGGYPARYGDRLSGIIELTANTVPDKRLNAGLGADLFGSNAFVELPITDKLRWFLSGCRSHHDIVNGTPYSRINDFLLVKDPKTGTPFQYSVDGKRLVPTVHYPYYDVTSKLSYEPSSHDRMSATLYLKRETQRDFWHHRQDSLLFQSDLSQEWRQLGISGNWRHLWSPRFVSEINAVHSSFSRLQRHITTGTVAILNQLSESNGPRVEDQILKMDNRLEWRNTALEFGFEYALQRIRFQWDHPFGLFNTVGANAPLQIGQKTDRADYRILHLQASWNSFKFLDVSAGVRVNDVLTRTPESYRKTIVDPRLSILLDITDRLALAGAWGRYHQFSYYKPDGLQDYYYYPDIQTWVMSDESEPPYVSNHLILNLRYNMDSYGFYAEAYDKNASRSPFLRQDLVDADDCAGSTKGVEFTVQKKKGLFLGWVSYRLNKTEYRFSETALLMPIPGNLDRTYEFKAVCVLNLRDFRLSVAGSFASGKPYSSFRRSNLIINLDGSVQWQYEYGPRTGKRLPTYQRVDVQLSKRFERLLFVNWELGVALLNVFDRKNVWEKRYWWNSEWESPADRYDVTMLGFTPMVFVNLELK